MPDTGICTMLSRLLGENHDVITVTDGNKGLEEFASGGYDVALIDLGMPGMSGDRVAKELHRRDPLVSTILITGWILDESDPRRASFDFQIVKPFDDLDRVEEVMTRAIELRDERVEKGS